MFYCMFYFTCDRSLTVSAVNNIKHAVNHRRSREFVVEGTILRGGGTPDI